MMRQSPHLQMPQVERRKASALSPSAHPPKPQGQAGHQAGAPLGAPPPSLSSETRGQHRKPGRKKQKAVWERTGAPHASRIQRGTRENDMDSLLRQTPQQKRAHERIQQRNDAYARFKCNGLKFWSVCRLRRCRRQRACSGADAQACWEKHWYLMPEDFKDRFRRAVRFMLEGMSPLEASAAADAAIAREQELLAQPTTLAPTAAPMRVQSEPPRLRRL
jgi:hypothetical protein